MPRCRLVERWVDDATWQHFLLSLGEIKEDRVKARMLCSLFNPARSELMIL